MTSKLTRQGFVGNVTDIIRSESKNVVFMGTGGRPSIFRLGYRFFPSEKGAAEVKAGSSPVPHVANWLDCVRSRKTPCCDEVPAIAPPWSVTSATFPAKSIAR